MSTRTEVLEFATLGLLTQSPLHGYELRKRISAIYGPFKALSFSMIYPQLRRLLEAGLIEQGARTEARRSRIVYRITKKGEKRFSELTENISPDSWDDDSFEVRFAFFGEATSNNRVRILEGRHRRLKEKAEILRADVERPNVGIDKYLEEWRRHSLESAEREIAWLEDLIQSERNEKIERKTK
jgi:DNA-binding PadR family transcriptional regulator